MKIQIETDQIDKLIKDKINDYLNSESGEAVLDKAIDWWIKKNLSNKSIDTKISERLSKVITTDVIGEYATGYNIDVFSDRLNEILTKIIQFDNGFKTAIRQEIKNTITIK